MFMVLPFEVFKTEYVEDVRSPSHIGCGPA